MRTLLGGMFVLALASTGCAHTGLLKEAAAADLNCEPRRVHILNSGRTRDVEACGQRATYRWEGGDWHMVGGPSGAPVAQPVQAQPIQRGPQPIIVQQPPPVQTAQPAPSTPTRPAMPPSQPPPDNGAPGRSL
ncbi:MAG: hypothetical protein KF819_09925 [Labilithrix sp.]|nr:hypothetical protein [Labilithrix sp.]